MQMYIDEFNYYPWIDSEGNSDWEDMGEFYEIENERVTDFLTEFFHWIEWSDARRAEEKECKQKLSAAIAKTGISINQVAGEDDPRARQVRWERSDRGVVTARTLIHLCAANPEISAEWLLRGEGEMLKANAKEEKEADSMGAEEKCETPIERIGELTERLERLQETIEEDREVDRFIAVLEQQAQLTKNAQEQVNRLIAILEKQITMGNEMVI